ncbi:MAG: T9SS type A sorting domain-containing protein [Bacteroidota bacterium]
MDNVNHQDVTTCYGDSNGSIQISPSGGFGPPWQYSIDNGLHYQIDLTLFPDLPAGDYQVVVIDKENCTEVGPLVTINQPDSLDVQVISTEDITLAGDGSIVVGTQGGTAPYTYTLLPDGILQGFGTFTLASGQGGKYVVEVSDGRLCGPASTDTIEILDFTTGVEEFGGVVARVFPNPATNLVTVEMEMEDGEAAMEVLSLTGQVVIRQEAYPSGGLLKESIDVSGLARGMYMLRINQRTLNTRIVVN